MTDNKKDLTRIEDLSEYLHESNPELDAQLKNHEDLPPQAPEQEDIPPTPTEENNDFVPSTEEFPPEFSVSKSAADKEDSNEKTFDPDAQTDPNMILPALDDSNPNTIAGEFAGKEEISLSSLPNVDFQTEDPDPLSPDASIHELGPESTNQSEVTNFSEDTFPVTPIDENHSANLSFGSMDNLESNLHEDSNLKNGDSLPEQDLGQAEVENQTFEVQNELEINSEENKLESEEVKTNITQAALPVENKLAESTPPASTPKGQENFEDLKNFVEAMSYGMVKSGGNPPYSIILKDICYKEDIQDIEILLKDHGIITKENESQYKKSLSIGQLLIPQLSEYSAIYLAHKLRRFSGNLSAGLSEEIRPPKNYQENMRGIVSKENLQQNRSEMQVMQNQIKPQEVILSTSGLIDGKTIEQYLGIISEHTILDESLLARYELKSYLETNLEKEQGSSEIAKALNELKAQWEKSTNTNKKDEKLKNGPGLEDIYFDLAQKLRPKAAQLKGNAVIGINYQITPLTHSGLDTQAKYKITCSGSVVLAA